MPAPKPLIEKSTDPREGEAELQHFLEHAVHDLRAAVRQIGTSAELLEGQLNEAGAPLLGRILEGIAKTNSILVSLSGYAMALNIGSFGRVKMSIALHSALTSLQAQIRQAEATVNEAMLPEVMGDQERLTQVFRILLSNALTYRRAVPVQISVTVAQQEDSWVFSVADNGIGIDPKYHHRLFTPFYRLHGADIPGVGLGLATSRKIVDAHRGKIWIESEKDKGTTVLFSLPRENPS